MSRVSKSNKPSANAMRIQAEENRKMLENIKLAIGVGVIGAAAIGLFIFLLTNV